MPAMKVTISAAMRARDVSRPRDEQVAQAEAAEAGVPSEPRADVTAAVPGQDEVRDGQEGTRRRRMPRDPARRGRSAR